MLADVIFIFVLYNIKLRCETFKIINNFNFQKQEEIESDGALEDGVNNFIDNDSSVSTNLTIYLYPNQYGGAVFVQDLESNSSNKIRTGFGLPPWIVQKALKILNVTNKHGVDSSQNLEAETLRRKQDEKLNKLTEEIKSIKKEFESLKYDMKAILSILKDDK